MQSHTSIPEPSQRMLELASALEALRDYWVEMSFALRDVLTEQESPQRDEVVMDVKRYLAKL